MRAQNSTAKSVEHFPLWLSPYETVRVFCELFRDELDHRSACSLDVQDLRRYYCNLFLEDGTPSPLGVYGYASRLAPVLLSLRDAGSAVRLLDDGCGYGTESLLFALCGAEVTGVELVPSRVRLARSRISFYQNHVSTSFSIEFINANVTRYLERAGPFHIVWVMEAISHIHPVEAFVRLVHKCLSPGGLLIISDPNAMNPVALYRAYRIRGAPRRTLRIKASDPDDGAPVYEAVERILSVPGLCCRLRKVGFEVRQVVMSGFLASSVVLAPLHRSRAVFTLLTSFQRMVQRLPVLRLMGTVYTVVAQKGYGDVSSDTDSTSKEVV
jgi:2-polyprenyl-3-methyl-5-hydroxy-6-metoxy-1,4-benzoquinol methylase